MERNSDNNLKVTDIKNPTCYHFNDVINVNDFDLDNILMDKKSYEIFLI